MAIQVKSFASFNNDTVKFEMDYDDVTMRPTNFRCINGSSQPAYAAVLRMDDSLVTEKTYPPNSTTNDAIPTGVGNTIIITDRSVAGSGKTSGFKLQCRYPA